jgi:hypothetical protein
MCFFRNFYLDFLPRDQYASMGFGVAPVPDLSIAYLCKALPRRSRVASLGLKIGNRTDLPSFTFAAIFCKGHRKLQDSNRQQVLQRRGPSGVGIMERIAPRHQSTS